MKNIVRVKFRHFHTVCCYVFCVFLSATYVRLLIARKKAKKPLLCCLASDGKLVFKTKADISFCGSYVIIIILEKCKKHFCSHEAENTQPLSRENNWSILLEKQLSFSTTFRVVLYTVWKNETFTLILKNIS